MSDEKFTDIDVRLAYQEKTIKDLSGVVYAQQKQIDALEKAVKALKERAVAAATQEDRLDILDEKPPHY